MPDHEHDHDHGHGHEGPSPGTGHRPGSEGPGATVAWFHCFSGIAGDMALGALIDAGADVDEVRTMLKRLPVDGWAIETETVLRSGIAGTKVHVPTEPDPPARPPPQVAAVVAAAGLPDRVRPPGARHVPCAGRGRGPPAPPAAGDRALPRGRGPRRHRRRRRHAAPPSSSSASTRSPPPRWPTALGTVRAAHGVLPVPVPAVVALLAGAPTYGLDIARELTTPTGAALLAANVAEWGPMPAMVVTSAGFGAGTADLGDRPNLTRVVVGRTRRRHRRVPGQPVVLLEANVDDVTGETLAYAVDALLAAGAHDAWITPIVMKKGRPAHTVSVLADPGGGRHPAGRAGGRDRHHGGAGRHPRALAPGPYLHHVEVDGHPVRVKVTAGRAKAEHDDAARAARALGLPLRQVVARAEATAPDS